MPEQHLQRRQAADIDVGNVLSGGFKGVVGGGALSGIQGRQPDGRRVSRPARATTDAGPLASELVLYL